MIERAEFSVQRRQERRASTLGKLRGQSGARVDRSQPLNPEIDSQPKPSLGDQLKQLFGGDGGEDGGSERAQGAE